MRRNLIKIAAITWLVLGGVLVVAPDTMAARLEERVRIIPNELDDIMITRIAPYAKEIDLEYHKVNPAYPDVPNRTAFRINIGYGNFSDMDIYSLDDYKSVSAQGLPAEVGAVKVTSMMVDSVKADWSDGQTLNLYGFMINANADLVNGSGGRLIYRILFTHDEVLLGRVDYTRCINSSVFISGEATECRMEYRANGKAQYQPYTSTGERVEIPAEEDAILTAATDAWEPEYGWPDLPPEPEPEPVEPEPTISEPEPTVLEPTIEPDPTVVESANSIEEPEQKIDSGVVLTGVKMEGTGVVERENNETTEKEIVMTEATDIASGDNGNNGTGRIDGVGMETVKSGDSLDYSASDAMGAVGVTGVTEIADRTDITGTNGDEKKEIAVISNDRQDDVEIPELGQETGKKPNIVLAIAAIVGAGVVLATAWWFLFIGKRKTNEGKERKE